MKLRALEAECLEHKLVIESQRLEMDEIHKKYEVELRAARALANERSQELESLREEIELTSAKFEEQVKEMKEKLRDVEENLHNKVHDYEEDTKKILKDTKNNIEIKMKESESDYQQLAGEIRRTEEELRKVTHHRDKLRISNMEHQLTIVELQDKIDMLVTELNSTRENYEADLAFVRNENSISKRQCKKLNIGIANIQASLEALRKRLLESERDVEQMTHAFLQVKAQKVAADEQNKTLSQELEAAKDSMSRLESETVSQIEEVRNGLLNKLEEFRMKAERNITAKEEEILEHRHKIEELSTRIFELNETLSAVEETNCEHEHEIEALTEKLDHQRDCAQYATQQIATLEASNAIYQHQIQTLSSELDYQKDFSKKASDHIATIATIKSNQETEINTLTAELNTERGKVLLRSSEIQEIRREFNNYKEEIQIILQNYRCDCKNKNEKGTEQVCEHQKKIEIVNSDVREFKKILDSAVESRILETKQDFQRSIADVETKASLADHWEKKYRELEALIGPFREQLEMFKEECKLLELKKEAAEEKMKEISLRYAETLGHQNHKQKIKHLIKLKEHNFELSKQVEKLEEQLKSQKKLIDKLKVEQRSTSIRKPVLQQHNPTNNSKGKENSENGSAAKPSLKFVKKRT
ncbi:hypothetical protein L9F63_001795 [Diploptera punctata]|uniref:Hyaluronan-mediated motility receptor C-terminal domain-containing protein n=1 Tax=Diploptera punctata TaxID=6984 RepID=A0AAD8A2V8_DIPPU|nr:hypothetical protein L9F63_001795 [Diploptera punctata]